MKVLDIVAGGLLILLGFPVTCYGIVFEIWIITAFGAVGVVIGTYMMAKAIEGES